MLARRSRPDARHPVRRYQLRSRDVERVVSYLLDEAPLRAEAISMNKLSTGRRAAIVTALCEGNSIRATVRMTGASRNTIVKLLVELGAACSKYQDETIRKVSAKRVQCDEIWSSIGAKAKNVREENGDKWGGLLDVDGHRCRLETHDFLAARSPRSGNGP